MLKINIIYNPVFPNFFFNIFQHLSTQAVSALKSSKMRLFTPSFPDIPIRHSRGYTPPPYPFYTLCF